LVGQHIDLEYLEKMRSKALDDFSVEGIGWKVNIEEVGEVQKGSPARRAHRGRD